MKEIVQKAIKEGMTYPQYRELVKSRLKEGKSTGTNHSEDMVNYTSLNDKRMDRLDKTTLVNPNFLRIQPQKQYSWLLLTEGWCGDAAQSVPVIAAIADQLDNIDLKIILRDEHPDVMDMYLTNGGKSIPKLISFEQDGLQEVAQWGPRPAKAQEMVMKYKALKDKLPYSEFVKQIQLWYAKDKTQSIQSEILDFVHKHSI